MKVKKMFFFFFFFICLQTHLSAMTTQGDKIINSSGQEVELKGFNWFGFNNQATMVDGLWSGSGPLASDFATVVYRLKLLGFNAVRLPFSFKDINTLSPRNYTNACQIPTQSTIQASVTNPSVAVGSKVIPPMIAPPPRVAGKCDDYLPNDTTLNRFLWTVNFFAKNGFYVLIDNHLREDQTVLENKQLWVQNWKDLVTKISQDPISKKMLMIDILNEPDEYEIKWETSGSTPGLKDLYLAVMDAVYPINSEALFFIEGTAQGDIGANWGDGFSTADSGLSNPSSFFNTLLTKPYLNQVVISPHVYPPSVTGASQNYSGSGLYNRLTASFGYLTQQGYCNGICKTFPVAIGEMGSRFTENNDIQSMQDFAKYLNNTGTGADGKHHAIKNWFYWSWNPNSSDTGGIVDDNWLSIIWKKIDYLTTIGLTPWYSDTTIPPVTPVKTGILCITVLPVTGLVKSDLKAIAINDKVYDFTDFNVTLCKTLPVGSYTITPPKLTTATMEFVANPQTVTVTDTGTTPVSVKYVGTPIVVAPVGDITVTVEIGSAWQDNPASGIYSNSLNFYITNNGATKIATPWKITVINSAYKTVPSFWNIVLNTIKNGQINGTVKESWQALSPKGANIVNFGMVVSSSSSNFMPTSILINDKPATIKLK